MIKVTWPYMFCNTPQPLNINSNKEYSVYKVNGGNLPDELLYRGVSAGVGGKPDISTIVQNYIKAPDYSKWLVRNPGAYWGQVSDGERYNFKATQTGQSTATQYPYTWGYPPTIRTEIEQEFGNVQDYLTPTLPFVVYGPYYKISFADEIRVLRTFNGSTSTVSVLRAWFEFQVAVEIGLKKTVVRNSKESTEAYGNTWPLSDGDLIGENQTYNTIIFHIHTPANLTLEQFIEQATLYGILITPTGEEIENPSIFSNQNAFDIKVTKDGNAGNTRATITMKNGALFRIGLITSPAVVLYKQLNQVTVQRFQSNKTTPDDSITLSPLPCSEGFTHCIYFLKLDGSVGWVFVKDKTGGKLNVTRDNYSSINISNTQAPTRLLTTTYRVGYYRTRSFNTGFLTAEQARKLQQLFISPRVWMMDLNGNLLGEVVVTDKSFEVKDRRVSEAPVSYTINVREAEDYSLVAR